MTQALGLLSGGLDSLLAAALLRRQGIDVTCIAFVSPFFGAARAEKAAHSLDLPLLVRDISAVHLETVKHPRYGYGRNMNPCIDCHALMFRLAGEIMRERGFDFLFSGEVLGQRPMSQNLSALQAVAKHSGVGDRILRPLSARCLPVTPMEEAGLVDRARLLDIQGRTRRRQQELAAAWGIVEYPSSGGGCLLTEERFSDRLRDLFAHVPDATVAEIELLKAGRHLRLSPHTKLLIGRDQPDNERLYALAGSGDLLLKAQGVSGPLGLVTGSTDEAELIVACEIVASYGKGAALPVVEVEITCGTEKSIRTVSPASRERTQPLLI